MCLNNMKGRILIFPSSYYSSSFFELTRFDFVMDEDLNVFLMEVS